MTMPLPPRLVPLTLLLLLTACGDKPAPQAQPRVVLAHRVHLGTGINQAEYSGEVRPRHEAMLGFRVGGKLIERQVDVGDKVTAGQVMARLDPADLAQSRQGVEAQRAAAAADRAFAQADLERYRSLHAQQFVSRAVLDAKATALAVAEEKWRAASAQVALARNQAGYAVLTADRSGVVAAVLAEVGQVLAAGQAVVNIAHGDEKEVLVAVTENRVAQLAAAGAVEVTLWAAPNQRYRGRIREVSPQADPVTRTYAARIALLDADADVRLGMTARIALTPGAGMPLTLIPNGAIFQKGAQPAVWVLDGARVHLRPVTVAAWREDGVAVQAGLAEGERIVAAGAYKLTEGEAVRVAP